MTDVATHVHAGTMAAPYRCGCGADPGSLLGLATHFGIKGSDELAALGRLTAAAKLGHNEASDPEPVEAQPDEVPEPVAGPVVVVASAPGSDVAGPPVPVQGTLDLPGIERLTSTAAHVAVDATAAEIDAMLRALDARSAALNWWIGDIVLAGRRLVQAGDQAMQACEPLVDQPTSARCTRVAAAYPIEERRPGLSWSHHELVVSHDPRNRARLLDVAEAEGLSVHALQAYMRQEALDVRGEEKPELPGMVDPKRIATRIAALWRHTPTVSLLVHPDGTVETWEGA